MSRLVKIVSTLRNHWKKSTFALCLVTYGVNYGRDKLRTNWMMKEYCKEAMKYGNIPITNEDPRHVTVILNPVAKKKKAKAQFEKYCAPLLHLAGMFVSVVQTDAEGQTRGFMEVMTSADAVAIAGGDGTLSEAVTGLLRRVDSTEVASKLPLAILPLGRTNSVASSIFGHQSHEVKFLAEATMALIRGASKAVDVMKIEAIQTETETPVKPVFALAEVQWGAYRDAHERRDQYWMWGPWRAYAAAVFSWFKPALSWDCQAELTYLAPCSGCSKCRGVHLKTVQQMPQQGRRWWQAFMPRTLPDSNAVAVDYSKIENPECGVQHSQSVSTIDLSIATSNARPLSTTCHPEINTPGLDISLGPQQDAMTFTQFVSEMWHRESGGDPQFAESKAARELWLRPVLPTAPAVPEETSEEEIPKQNENEYWLSIDQEKFDLRPMHITLLPKSVRLFCPVDQYTK